MTYFKHFKRCLLTALSAVMLCTTAQAATQRSADFEPGHTLGVGLFGFSYDAGWGPVSLGVSSNALSYSPYGNLNYSARALYRLMENEGLSAALIGGVQFSPGYPGGTANLTPDVGVSLAYDLREHEWPWAVRMNMTLGYRSHETSAINPFQKISVGPQTSLELAYIPNDDFEFTLGGGTFVGMRLKF